MPFKKRIFLSLFFIFAPSLACAQDAIEWKVADRFRLFNADETANQIKADDNKSAADILLDSLNADLQKNAGEEIIYPKIRDFLLQNNQFEQTAWQASGFEPDGKVKASRKYRDDYLYPQGYNVRARLASQYIQTGDNCLWQIIGESEITPLQTTCEQAVILPIKANEAHDGAQKTQILLRQFRANKQIFETKTNIEFNDRLIIALGDSYASGEGNPDRPQSFGKDDDTAFQAATKKYFENGIDPYERWWAKNSITPTIIPANWWDGICHRSLFSQHVIGSLLYAAKNPHQSVSFATYACSGAMVFGGILTPQSYPVGQLELGAPNLPKGVKFKVKPQLEAAIETLCQNQIENVPSSIDFSTYSARFSREETIKSAIKDGIGQSVVKCKNDFIPRKVDNILLSVGGNDAGFVAAIVNALVPNNKDSLVDFAKENFGIEPTYIAERKVRFLLPTIYSVLDTQLKAGIFGEHTKVIQTQYPMSFMNETGKNYCDGPNDNKLFAAFNSLYLDEKTKSSKRWRTEITEGEGRDVRENLYDPLNLAIAQNSNKNWNIIGFGNKFDARGWCAGSKDEKVEFAFPALDYNGQWTPFNPKDWQPYAMRTRLFRSANDTALTQIGSNKGFPVIDTIFDQDRSIFATFGMFHPSAEGHTIMALEVFKELQK